MNCLDCQALLQERLDGARLDGAQLDGERLDGKPPLRTPELDQHLAHCADCRELFAAARVLSEGLPLLPRPAAAEGLTERIVAAALADRKQRQRRVRLRVYVTAALAASILVLLFAGYLLPTSKHKEPAPIARKDVPDPAPQPPQPPALAQSASEARQAVTQLTGRVADQTRDQAKLLLAMANPLELPNLAAWPGIGELDEPLDPAAKSLREATQTVAEPMARTARGAWNLFMKELPVLDVNPSN